MIHRMSQDPYPNLPRMAEPVEYSSPVATRGRPGILTAVGIMSIVMAVLGFGAAGVSGMVGLGMYMMGAASRAMQIKPITPAPPVTSAITSSVFTDKQALDPVKLKHLELLLKDYGSEVAGNDVSPGFIRESRTWTSTDGQPITQYVTRTGRVEVFSDHAVFYPTSGYPIRNVVADADSDPTATTLSDKQIDKIVARVQTLTNNAMNPAQVSRLKTTLQEPGQNFIPMPSPSPESAVTHAMKRTDGSVMVLTSNGNMTIATDGTRTMYRSYSAAGISGPGGMPQVDQSAALLTIVSSVLNAILSIFLLVIGILVLNDSRNGRLLHRIFAYVKLVVVVGAGLAQFWLFQSLVQNNPAGAPNPSTYFGVASVVGIGLGCIYPIALIIVFGTRKVREYYSASWIGTYR